MEQLCNSEISICGLRNEAFNRSTPTLKARASAASERFAYGPPGRLELRCTGGSAAAATEPGAGQREPSDTACAPGALTAGRWRAEERRSAAQEPRQSSKQRPALRRRGSAAQPPAPARPAALAFPSPRNRTRAAKGGARCQ